MKDRKKIRKVLAGKVAKRLARVRQVLNTKLLLEEMDIPSKGKPFAYLAEYVLNAPFGLEEC